VTVLCLAPTSVEQRFIRGYPPKGAYFFLRPPVEVRRLATLVAAEDGFLYQDQRVDQFHWTGAEDVCLVYSEFSSEHGVRETANALAAAGRPCLLFGPLVTADARLADRHPHVVGDITLAWPEIRHDLAAGTLKTSYRAPRQPASLPARGEFGRRPEMYLGHQAVSFLRGCSCPEPFRAFCPEHLYFGSRQFRRTREEIVGELLDLPHKPVQLLDDDVAADPDYYLDIFARVWDFRRHWFVNAGERIFDHPRLIRTLARAGARSVLLNESFLWGKLEPATHNKRLVRRLYRRVKYLQSRRMLVGARVPLELPARGSADFPAIARVLHHIDLDFIETVFFTRDPQGRCRPVFPCYRPSLEPTEPAWLKNSFYSMRSILDRLARRPRRVGFYTTGRYLLPLSMSYRQSFLECLPVP